MQDETEQSEDSTRITRWLRVASLIFGAWAAAVPISAVIFNKGVDRVVTQQEQFRLDFERYVLSMERRVTIIEERQSGVLRKLEVQDNRLERLDRDVRVPHDER